MFPHTADDFLEFLFDNLCLSNFFLERFNSFPIRGMSAVSWNVIFHRFLFRLHTQVFKFIFTDRY